MKKQVSIAVSSECYPQTNIIAQLLRDNDVTVDDVIEEIGVIYLSVTDAEFEILSTMKGIEEIKTVQNIQLPPMSEDIPQ